MKKILFPTDFSDVASNAFEYALDLAERLDAEVILLHAYHYATADEMYIPAEMIEALTMEKEDAAMEHFEAYEARIQEKRKNKVPVKHILKYGFASDVVTEASTDLEPDMVIMGTKGAGTIAEKLLGSVASHVIQNASVPVLAIPDEARYSEIKKIAYATDFEEDEFKVIDGLLRFAALFDAQIECVHISGEDNKWTKLHLDFFERIYALETKSDNLNFYILNHADIAEGLNQFVETYKVDLLAMLTHKRNMIQRLFNPSLTRKVVLHTEVPLLAFHAH